MLLLETIQTNSIIEDGQNTKSPGDSNSSVKLSVDADVKNCKRVYNNNNNKTGYTRLIQSFMWSILFGTKIQYEYIYNFIKQIINI